MSDAAKEKLAKLEEKRAELNSEIRKVRSKVKQEAQRKKRRREAIIGRMIIERQGGYDDALKKLAPLLDEFVTRESDRELFGLDPLSDGDDLAAFSSPQNSPTEGDATSAPRRISRRPSTPNP